MVKDGKENLEIKTNDSGISKKIIYEKIYLNI